MRTGLVESNQQKGAAHQQQMLQGDGSPIEADGQEINRIHGEQTASNDGGTVAGDAPEQQKEKPQAGGAGQEHGFAKAPETSAENAEDRAIDPGFERSQIAHQHDGNLGLPYC